MPPSDPPSVPAKDAPDGPGAGELPRVQILGIRFLLAEAPAAVAAVQRGGGLLVAPASTSLVYLCDHGEAYRRAMSGADFAIADSGAMVLLWRALRGGRVPRVSGLRYLCELLAVAALRVPGGAFWVLPNEEARAKALAWLPAQGVPATAADCWVAPLYDRQHVEDPALLRRLAERRPANVIVGLSGGVQEPLGMFLRDALPYRPAIHCLGAALGFLTGDQRPIPDWADRFYLGWLLRWAARPRTLTARMARAFELPGLLWRCGENLPPSKRAGVQPAP